MTQKRYFDYQSPQEAWTDAQQFLGILESARYRGFDSITAINSTTVSISHGARGLVSKNIAGTDKPSTGIWVSKQGVIIQEDGPISLNNASFDNTLGTNKRIFAIYGNHAFTEVPGGASATYGVAVGDTSGNYPSLPLATNVLLLYIHIPAGQTMLGGGVYVELPKVFGLGAEDAAMTQWENIFKMMNQLNQSPEAATYSSGAITLNQKGNTFKVNLTGNYNVIKRPANAQAGLKIVLLNTNGSERRIQHNPDNWAKYLANDSGYNSIYDSGSSYIYLTGAEDVSDIYEVKQGSHNIAVFELVDHGGTRGLWWHCTYSDSLWAYIKSLIESDIYIKQAVIGDSLFKYKNTYRSENYTLEESKSDTPLSIYNTPGNAGSGPVQFHPGDLNPMLFDPSNVNYEIELRITARLRLEVSSHTNNSTWAVYVAKNWTSGSPDPNDPTKGFFLESDIVESSTLVKFINATALFKAKISDTFTIFIIGSNLDNVTMYEIDDISQNITYEPVTRFVP